MPAKAQRRAPLVALGRVVEDDVEDHLEAGAVQRPHHATKLVHLSAAVLRRVAVVRGEVADRLVAPVVAQSALHQLRVVDELVHRQELDRGDAEALQVSQRGGMREAGVGAAKFAGHAGVQLGEALDVDLVEDRVGHLPSGRRVAVPVEVRGDDDGARHVGRRVARVREIRIVGGVAVDGGVPLHLARDRTCVRVEQELGRVAAGASGRAPWAVHAIAVALPRSHVAQVALPHVPLLLLETETCLGASVVEEAELDLLRDAAEQREAGSAAVVADAERCCGGRLEHAA